MLHKDSEISTTSMTKRLHQLPRKKLTEQCKRFFTCKISVYDDGCNSYGCSILN